MNTVLLYSIFGTLYLVIAWKAARIYPILYLFVFTYFIQYVFSTYLIYFSYDILSYQMPIGPQVYFEYVIPALLSLFAGAFIFNRDIDISESLKGIDAGDAKRLAYLLLVISYSFDLFSWLGFSFLSSVISFTGFLKYLGAFCLLYSRSKFGYVLIVAIYLQLVFVVLQGGVFITLFVWSTFLFFFFAIKFQLPFIFRVAFIVLAIPILILVQSVKDQYRKETWTGRREGGIGLFNELVQKQKNKTTGEPFAETEGVVSTVGRLSQGWHLGLTLKRVPLKEPYANGREMSSDVVSSILPRLFFEDKKKVNSQDKFYQYTGHKLRGSTSMSIGLLGDFYINFGVTGSFVGLFIFGGIIAKLLQFFIRRYVLPDPINIIWIPFILNYLIRANNDFYIFFNGMIKGFVVFLLVNYVRQKLWKKAPQKMPEQKPLTV